MIGKTLRYFHRFIAANAIRKAFRNQVNVESELADANKGFDYADPPDDAQNLMKEKIQDFNKVLNLKELRDLNLNRWKTENAGTCLSVKRFRCMENLNEKEQFLLLHYGLHRHLKSW
jgi:hypothetical protein